MTLEYERIPGYERFLGDDGTPHAPVPGTGPIEAVRMWEGRVYAARSGCVWVANDVGGWTLADGEALPPSFPPRRERTESTPSEAEG